MFLLVAIYACAPSSDPGAPAAETPVVADDADAKGARVPSADAPAADPSLLVAATLGQVLGEAEVADYAADGTVAASARETEACVDASLDAGDLVLDFDACDGLAGTVRLSWADGATTLTFEEGFQSGDRSITGSVTVDLDLRGDSYAVEGALTVTGADTRTVSLDLTLTTGGSLSVWGATAVGLTLDGAPVEVSATLGSEADPLAWASACACPTSGVLETALTASLDAVDLDLDDLFRPRDGVDDYPPIEVPLATPVEAWASLTLTFAGTCGDQSVSLAADDLELELTAADLEAAVDEACATGAYTVEQCDELAVLLPWLPDPLSVTLAASLYAAAAEPAVEAAVDEVCSLGA